MGLPRVRARGLETYAALLLGENVNRRNGGLWFQRHLLPSPESRRGIETTLSTADWLWTKGEQSKATTVLRLGQHNARAGLGDDDELTVRATRLLVERLCRQAEEQEDLGDLDEARHLAQEAAEVETDPHATRASFCLAQVLKRQGQYDESVRLQRQVLSSSTARNGPNGAMTVHSLIQLSNVLYLRRNPGDLDEARLLAQQAVSAAVGEAGDDCAEAVAARELLSEIESASNN